MMDYFFRVRSHFIRAFFSGLLFCLLLTGLGLMGCSKKLKPSKELVIATSDPIGKVDPWKSPQGLSANLVELIHPPLFHYSFHGDLLPVLAEKGEWSPDYREFKVTLRGPFADEVLYSIQQANKFLAGDFHREVKNIQDVEKLSSTEVLFKLERFDRAFIYFLETLPIVAPEQEVNSIGPFRLLKQTEEEVVLERKQPSPDKVNVIRIQSIPSARRAMRELVAGNVDMLFPADELDYDSLSNIPQLKIAEFSTGILYVLFENQKRDKGDLGWSRLNLQLDRGAFPQLGRTRKVRPAFSPLPPSFNFSVKELGMTEKALNKFTPQQRELMFLENSFKDVLLARFLKRQFQEMGIQLTTRPLKFNDFLNEVFVNRNFDLVLLFQSVRDPFMSNYYLFHTPEWPHSPNILGYSNIVVDRYLEQARYGEDEGKAREALTKAIEVLLDDPPGLFLYWWDIVLVYRKSCSGFKFNSAEFFSSLQEVRCEP